MFNIISLYCNTNTYSLKYHCLMKHIGQKIKNVVKDKGLSVSEFGRRIFTHRRNVYDIFERESIDTSLLEKISKVLDYNFFQEFDDSGLNKDDSSTSINEIYQEKITNLNKEIEYLKQIIIEKDKIISILESAKNNS